MALFVLGSMVSATIFIPFMLLKPRDSRNALLPAWGCRQIAKVLGLKFVVHGHKNIVQEEGAVVLINHQSLIDLIVLAELWPVMDRCTVISKREIFYLWPFGLASWLWGTVFINRGRAKDAQETVNQTSKTINTRKSKILMFPEGTRHGGDTLLPFKKGGFHIAVACQTKIQPVVVSQYTFLDYESLTFDSGTVEISILPPIETEGLTKEDMPALMDKTYNIMTKEYNKLCGFDKTTKTTSAKTD
ncbi:hypothetical protein GE061_012428 [Apolygus lucorum]|uniref:1-acyl-sn-glycerol-3-phosphate acyltransferase n=1 Tax=Apolygus lucorum TaxID=248454 RepID=A0A6A4K0L5_APOLU|nr:hypothetical protein GE061_012428 [Apolygus lucorum]